MVSTEPAAGQSDKLNITSITSYFKLANHASFLPGPRSTVEQRLQTLALHRVNLREGAVLETGCVYIVPLLESLALPAGVSAAANPKSSTGRLDIFTRVTEYKHLTGQNHPQTSVTYEYPSSTGDPYYPIPRPENHALYKKYELLANATSNVWFAGRLATYRYYNMDQIVGQALATFRRIEETIPRKSKRTVAFVESQRTL